MIIIRKRSKLEACMKKALAYYRRKMRAKEGGRVAEELPWLLTS